MSQYDNPQAFPSTTEVLIRNGNEGFAKHLTNGGMSLRDYFAAKTMQGMVSSIDSDDNYYRLKRLAYGEGLTVSEWIARDSYKQADAMLKARKPKP